MNDSTDYQVYGNSRMQESSTRAVEETRGQVVRYKGGIATTYYYSTSCGRTTSLAAWGTQEDEENGYLRSVEVKGEDGDYEKSLPWYRWTARVPAETLSALVSANTGVAVGALQSVEVTARGPGDVALQITASGDAGSVTVDTENKIRTALGGSGYTIEKNDGTAVQSTALLPSAFFSIEKSGDAFVIRGGGFGHGIGMSQNGANEMAKAGKDYQEILNLGRPLVGNPLILTSVSYAVLAITEEPEVTPSPTPAPTPMPTPAPTPAPTPEVVTAVAQEYSPDGVKLPSNVSYERYELGLEETVCPVMGPVSSTFGYRTNPITQKNEFHLALDIAADEGTEIHAFADGVVEYIGQSDDFGLYFKISHANGVSTFYAHCSELLIQKGDPVTCGQTVALVGETGMATGPHLHLTVEKDNIRLDPAYYVDPS